MSTPTTSPRRRRRAAGWAANLGLVLVTLIGAAYLAPALLGFERYVITGGSMSGTYEKGSMVFERSVPVDELEVGDVITYQPPASSGVTTLVTHRIIAIGEDDAGRRVLRTQGDANPDPDPWRFSMTAPDQPVVEWSVPYVGWALVGLADREIRRVVIGVPAAVVALISLGQLISALRGSRHRVAQTAAPAA